MSEDRKDQMLRMQRQIREDDALAEAAKRLMRRLDQGKK